MLSSRRLVLGEHRRLTAAHDMLGLAHRMRRVDSEDLADDQPVEQHANGRKVLLHRRLGGRRLQRLDIGRDVDRLDIGEFADLVLLDPGKKVAHGPVIGHAGIFVSDLCGEEFEEAAGRMIPDIRDHCRHRERAAHCG
jgi:hypothetical protein